MKLNSSPERGLSTLFLSLVVMWAHYALVTPRAAALEARDFAVEATAQVRSAPAQIRLSWPPSSFATGYSVSRKTLADPSWKRLTDLPPGATGYVDSNVVLGAAYEYEILRRSSDGVLAFGYLYAGIEVPFSPARGRLILVVDSTFTADLAPELTRLASDLVGDGWTVVRYDVARTASVTEVKNLIRAEYAADPSQTRSVFLVGHVPVPYSGDINPDMHAAHKGAWPADGFYGQMEGEWTDRVVHDSTAEDPRNYNIPGDGKFDQSEFPGRVSLQVGRVDLTDLQPFTATSELELLRQYLNKNHAYRHREFAVDRRGLIRDNFGEIQGDAPAADAWRSFTAFFGGDAVESVGPGEFFPALASRSYLWAYGGGGGGYYQADTVGTSSDFINQRPQAVFYMLHGSFFGDWDSNGNLLRAALASPGYGLAAAWTGLPHWFLHHMALGEPIGLSTLLAQNNRGLYQNQVNLSVAQVHIALMGDPTLRMHVVAPPGNLTTTTSAAGAVTLNWTASPDAVLGYYIYRAAAPAGPFARLTRSFLTSLSFTDLSAPAGRSTYMVRAVKLESTPSGTYYNPSQGLFVESETGGPTLPEVSVTASASSVDESPSAESSFLLRRSAALDTELRVALSLEGSASNGVDVALLPDSVVFSPGQNSVSLAVKPLADDLDEDDENVVLTVQPGPGYVVGSPNAASILIKDRPVQQPPSLALIADQTMGTNVTSLSIPVVLADADTPATELQVTAESSNPALIQADGITIEGTELERRLILRPNPGQSGTATITLTVTDSSSVATRSFLLTVVTFVRILGIARQVEDGSVLLQFEGIDAGPYLIEASSDLHAWTSAGPAVAATNAVSSFLDHPPAAGGARFYRVRRE